MRNACAGGVGAGEKQAVNFLLQQGRTDGAAARQADKHVFGHAGAVQQAGDSLAGHGGVFRGFVKHGIAGQQRRNEDIAADKPGVVPGRYIGHHAQRRVLDLLGHAAFAEDCLGRGRGLDLFEEKVDAAQQAIELIARHADRLAGFPRHDGGQGLKLGHDGCAKTRDAGLAHRQRQGGPGGLGGARLPAFGGDASGIVSRQFGDQRASGGVVDGK